MKAKTWEQDGLWYWHILDEYGDEVSSADTGFESRAECRQEMHAALEGYQS